MKRGAIKVYFKTYGCVLNRFETDIMKAIVKREGMSIVDDEEKADVVVVNTCTVKDATEKKTLSYLKRLKSSGTSFVIAGCLTVNDYIEKYNVPVIETGAIRYVGSAIEDAVSGRAMRYSLNENKTDLPVDISLPISRIGIQEGCTNRCTYCQTKLARPVLRSMPIERVKELIKEAASKGAVEIQLTGTDVGAYGLDIKENLSNLMAEIIKMGINPPPFIRIGMANPHHVYRELNGIIKNLKKPFYTFMHIPVQSGSNSVLKHMRRGYTREIFKSIVERLKATFDEITIATDIIVGYPTESEEDFEQTISLIEETKPNVVNISKFSPRPGTEAALMEQIDRGIVNRRSSYLTSIVKEIVKKENEKLIGKSFPVVITEKGKQDTLKGRTFFCRQVVVEGIDNKIGDIINVEITGITETSLIGKSV